MHQKLPFITYQVASIKYQCYSICQIVSISKWFYLYFSSTAKPSKPNLSGISPSSCKFSTSKPSGEVICSNCWEETVLVGVHSGQRHYKFDTISMSEGLV